MVYDVTRSTKMFLETFSRAVRAQEGTQFNSANRQRENLRLCVEEKRPHFEKLEAADRDRMDHAIVRAENALKNHAAFTKTQIFAATVTPPTKGSRVSERQATKTPSTTKCRSEVPTRPGFVRGIVENSQQPRDGDEYEGKSFVTAGDPQDEVLPSSAVSNVNAGRPDPEMEELRERRKLLKPPTARRQTPVPNPPRRYGNNQEALPRRNCLVVDQEEILARLEEEKRELQQRRQEQLEFSNREEQTLNNAITRIQVAQAALLNENGDVNEDIFETI